MELQIAYFRYVEVCAGKVHFQNRRLTFTWNTYCSARVVQPNCFIVFSPHGQISVVFTCYDDYLVSFNNKFGECHQSFSWKVATLCRAMRLRVHFMVNINMELCCSVYLSYVYLSPTAVVGDTNVVLFRLLEFQFAHRTSPFV